MRTYVADRYDDADVNKVMLTPDHGKLFVDWVNKPKNFLVLLGAAGVGKTYNCKAVLKFLKTKFNYPCRYWQEGELLQNIRQSMDNIGDYLSYLKYKIDDYILIYDDLGSNPVNDWRREIIFELINTRYNLEYPTIFTSNLTKNELQRDYGNRIISRLYAKENTIIECYNYKDLREDGK